MLGEHARALIEWAGATFPTAAWIDYEPVCDLLKSISYMNHILPCVPNGKMLPHDAFGKVMVNNLQVRMALSWSWTHAPGPRLPAPGHRDLS